MQSARLLIVGLVAVIVVLGLILIIQAVGTSRTPGLAEAERPDALANSTNDCVTCHRESTPGIVEQYGHSTMAGAKVECQDCHEVARDYPGSVEHEGTFVLSSPTPAMCQKCHQQEVAQFNASRHSIPAYVAMTGQDILDENTQPIYDAITEVEFGPEQMRNALFAIEGPEITRFACENCHNIGKPQLDGSVGQCQKCHLRHEFTLEQARKPETCNNCHIGPDHPQFEIYQESAHGIAYQTSGDNWNWDAEPGTLTVSDFPAPTCSTCHFSGFGSQGTTHDVGDRLTWYLFAPISERRAGFNDNRVRMQSVCTECHNTQWVADFYSDADAGTEAINELVRQSDGIAKPLKDQGLLTKEPFDDPFDFTYFETWHHWGRTAKFGIWMQGADYTQWHGVYEMLSDLAELQEMADEMLKAAEESK
jgi:hypothetical protein